MRLLRLTVVLAAVDCDESSGDALRAAGELSRLAGAKLHVVHVDSSASPAPSAGIAPARKAALAKLLDRAGLAQGDAPLHLLAGDPPNQIRSLGDRLRADVIVLGRHRGRSGPSADGTSLGSTALSVVTSSWAPCLVLSQPMRLPLERVLVPVDLSDTSRGALVVGLSWASALRRAERAGASTGKHTVSLTALFVDSATRAGGESPHRAALDEALRRLRDDAGTWASVGITGEVVSSDDVPTAIASYANEHNSDLVVLGTRGLGLDAVGRLGSVSLAVAGQVRIPILLVPPAVWHSYSTQS